MTGYHLRPKRGWLNDPNGMTYRDGLWHVFFQHNPDAPRHAQIAWGHAVTRDLANWELLPDAFAPTPGGPDGFGCWSGVFYPGLERPAVVYSGVAAATGESTVCLRWGSEDLLSWGEPVVVAETPTADGIQIMRDPFLFEWEGRELAVVGAGLKDGSPVVLVFDRTDPLNWRYENLLVADDAALNAVGGADIWECPQLFQLGGKWVLIVSIHESGDLAGTAVAIGDLREGLRFVTESASRLDVGTHFYAPQVSLADGEPLMIGWVRQDGCEDGSRDHAGCLSLPRRLRVEGGRVLCRVDAQARAALLGADVAVPTGPVDLGGRRWAIEAVGDLVLEHPELGPVEVTAGAEIWVDGDVIELYPAAGVPATWRHDLPWRLVAPEGAARIRDVVPRVP